MSFSRKSIKTGLAFGWLEIIALATIAGLAASTLTIAFTKCIKDAESIQPGVVIQGVPITGTAIGAFYNNLKEETIWISGPDKAVACVKTALQARNQ